MIAERIISSAKKRDIEFMKIALDEAQEAFKRNEIPVGSVIVDNSFKMIAKAYNQVESKKSQSRHAEIIAIEKAGKVLNDWRMTQCTIYVTLEPCLMCFALIGLSRLERIVYATKSPIYGYDIDNEILPDLYKKSIKGISTGILKDEAEFLLKKFFNKKRNKE